MVVPMMFFVAAWSYALCVNFVPVYRDTADKFSTTKIGMRDRVTNDEENGVRERSGEKDIESVENREQVSAAS
jgi:FHS family L-fucose permease-like MFS transporter